MKGYYEYPPLGHMLNCLEKHDIMIKGPGEQHRVRQMTFLNDGEVLFLKDWTFPNNEKVLLPEEGGKRYWADDTIRCSLHKINVEYRKSLGECF